MPAELDIDTVKQRFRAARGETADAAWAREALGSLVFEDVRLECALEAVAELAPIIAESGESPTALFGKASRWAEDRRAQWHADGVDVAPVPERPTLRGFLKEVLLGTALISPVIGIYSYFAGYLDEPYPAGLLLFPVLLSVAGSLAATMYQLALRRFPFKWAIAIVIGGCILPILVITTVVLSTKGSFLEVKLAWFFGLSIASAIGAVLIDRFWPRPTDPAIDVDTSDDDEWATQVTAALRARGDMPESEIGQIIIDARAHAHDAGVPLVEEFGSTQTYAARFAANPAVRSRREALTTSALAVLVAVLILLDFADTGSLPTWELVVFTLCAASSVSTWRSYAAAKRDGAVT